MCVSAAYPSPFVAVVAVVQGETPFQVAKGMWYSAADLEELEVRWMMMILTRVLIMMMMMMTMKMMMITI